MTALYSPRDARSACVFAARQRSSSRGASMRCVQASNSRVGPRQRNWSTSSNTGASRRSVARRLNSNACSRRSPSTVGRERLDRPMPIQQARRPHRADAGDTRVAVRSVADQRQKVWNQRRLDAELLAHARGIANRLGLAVDLHDAVAFDALREVLVRSPDADLLHPSILGGKMRCGGQRIVGLQVDHRPDGDAHRPERVLQRVELRQQSRLDAVAGLVARPQAVAERLDDVVGGDAQVRLAALDELQHALQHANHGTEAPILSLVESALAIEVAEQLVRAVDQMNHDRRARVSGWCRSGAHRVAHSAGQRGAIRPHRLAPGPSCDPARPHP